MVLDFYVIFFSALFFSNLCIYAVWQEENLKTRRDRHYAQRMGRVLARLHLKKCYGCLFIK